MTINSLYLYKTDPINGILQVPGPTNYNQSVFPLGLL